jgi:hypothetical protein
MTRNTRIALILAAVVVAVGAGVVIGTGGDDKKSGTSAAATTAAPASTGTTKTATTPPKPVPPPVPTVRLRGGKPVGGVQTLEFRSGKPARFVVTSDTEAQIHLHGYNIEKTVPAGGRATWSFQANGQGVFELESHTTNQVVAKVKVVP